MRLDYAFATAVVVVFVVIVAGVFATGLSFELGRISGAIASVAR